jgi:multisubunit Na+/H+ antiporter MnhB subunit
MRSRAVIFEVAVRGLYPVMLIVSLWLLLRGHNAPGGGFVGGLVAVAASAVYAIAFGTHRARRRLPLQPPSLAAAGVLLALASGLPALLEGLPYLTHPWITMPLGATGLPLSTVMLFDLGVYCCVWGAIGGYCLELLGGQEGNA